MHINAQTPYMWITYSKKTADRMASWPPLRRLLAAAAPAVGLHLTSSEAAHVAATTATTAVVAATGCAALDAVFAHKSRKPLKTSYIEKKMKDRICFSICPNNAPSICALLFDYFIFARRRGRSRLSDSRVSLRAI